MTVAAKVPPQPRAETLAWAAQARRMLTRGAAASPHRVGMTPASLAALVSELATTAGVKPTGSR